MHKYPRDWIRPIEFSDELPMVVLPEGAYDEEEPPMIELKKPPILELSELVRSDFLIFQRFYKSQRIKIDH